MSAAARHWLAVASAEHVERGVAGGFMQVCHGKAAPLRRIRPGDEIAYYSPARSFGGNDSLRAFTACGVVLAGDPYVFEMDGGFRPFRRDVAWRAAGVAPIRPLLGELEFAAGTSNWGYRLRFGWSEISAHDMALIRRALGVCHSDASARPGAR